MSTNQNILYIHCSTSINEHHLLKENFRRMSNHVRQTGERARQAKTRTSQGFHPEGRAVKALGVRAQQEESQRGGGRPSRASLGLPVSRRLSGAPSSQCDCEGTHRLGPGQAAQKRHRGNSLAVPRLELGAVTAGPGLRPGRGPAMLQAVERNPR